MKYQKRKERNSKKEKKQRRKKRVRDKQRVKHAKSACYKMNKQIFVLTGLMEQQRYRKIDRDSDGKIQRQWRDRWIEIVERKREIDRQRQWRDRKKEIAEKI